MKENRFIELVNLYIDREITPEETAELELELQASPARRTLYGQYCRMHRATELVHAGFRTHTLEPGMTVESGESGVVERFEVDRRRRRGYRWIAYTGGLAAAACLTFMVTRVALHRGDSAQPAALTAQTAPAPAATPAGQPEQARMVAVAADPERQPVARPGLASLSNDLIREAVAVPTVTALQTEANRSMLTLLSTSAQQPQSLFDDGVFDTTKQPAVPTSAQRAFQNRPASLRQQAEFTGFQFQR